MFSPCWHQPHSHLGHPAFPSRSGCTSPVAHGREPGCIPGEDGGLGAAGCGILCAEARPCLYKCWQSQPNAYQLQASATPQKAHVSIRLALVPALENKWTWWGLQVCICYFAPGDLPAQPVCCSAALPQLCLQERTDIICGVSFLVFHVSGSCLTIMPSTSVVVSASTMWWISQGQWANSYSAVTLSSQPELLPENMNPGLQWQLVMWF